MATTLVGLRELRVNTEKYINRVRRGESFLVARRSRPVFRITPPEADEGFWETVVDFTKIKKSGVPIGYVLVRL